MTNLSPIGWAIRPFKYYANFSGRAPRAELWWFFLFAIILYVLLGVVGLVVIGRADAAQASPSLGLIGAFGVFGLIIILFWLVLLLPTIAVQTRRLHDTGRSGWWLGAYYLLYLAYLALVLSAMPSTFEPGQPQGGSPTLAIAVLPVGLGFLVYSIVLLIFYCLPGTKGANRYGPDPYGADVGEVFA
jgi:uncharacterized membrane protein YhaH (DUF805 family)